MAEMEYRRLGSSGLKVSVLSFGSWVSFGTQMDTGLARDCIAAAWDAGVNFFDNAEAYAGGESERIMGAALAELGYPRNEYVVSSKFFWGIGSAPNRSLMGSLGEVGRGFTRYVQRLDDAEPVAKELVERSTQPFLTPTRSAILTLDSSTSLALVSRCRSCSRKSRS